MVSSKEAKTSINPPPAVVKDTGVLSVFLSDLFCSIRRVINKCFRCDAIGLAMLEEGAAQCDSCWGRPHKADEIEARTNRRGLSKCCLPRDEKSSCPESSPGKSGGRDEHRWKTEWPGAENRRDRGCALGCQRRACWRGTCPSGRSLAVRFDHRRAWWYRAGRHGKHQERGHGRSSGSQHQRRRLLFRAQPASRHV